MRFGLPRKFCDEAASHLTALQPGETLRDLFEANLGKPRCELAGSEVLVEEFMEGEEVSVFAITNGEWLVTLPPAQDHKRLLAGDRGPNRQRQRQPSDA